MSPIVAGRAVKGPLATMITHLTGRTPSARAVALHYRDRYGDLLGGMVVERGDEAEVRDLLPVRATATIMGDRDDRARLAREVLTLAETLL